MAMTGAMILEVVRADGTRGWHRLDAGTTALTIGRGFSNDLILDDPYVDARHLRLARTGDGALIAEDLGSVNGVVVDAARVHDTIAIVAGAELRVGRTTLRFRAPDEAVVPALADEPPVSAPPDEAPAPAKVIAAVPTPLRRWRRLAETPPPRWTTTTTGGLMLATGAALAFALHTFLGDVTRSSTGTVFGTALLFAFCAALWAGTWAVASRVIVQRFSFIGHLALFSAVAAGALASTIAGEWLAFLVPDTMIAAALPAALFFGLLAALVAGHMMLASSMPRQRSWITGLAFAGALYGIVAISALAVDDKFSDVPTFSSALKPLPARWLPTRSIDEFGNVMQELREDVDEQAARQSAERERTDSAAASAPASSLTLTPLTPAARTTDAGRAAPDSIPAQ